MKILSKLFLIFLIVPFIACAPSSQKKDNISQKRDNIAKNNKGDDLKDKKVKEIKSKEKGQNEEYDPKNSEEHAVKKSVVPVVIIKKEEPHKVNEVVIVVRQ